MERPWPWWHYIMVSLGGKELSLVMQVCWFQPMHGQRYSWHGVKCCDLGMHAAAGSYILHSKWRLIIKASWFNWSHVVHAHTHTYKDKLFEKGITCFQAKNRHSGSRKKVTTSIGRQEDWGMDRADHVCRNDPTNHKTKQTTSNRKWLK